MEPKAINEGLLYMQENSGMFLLFTTFSFL